MPGSEFELIEWIKTLNSAQIPIGVGIGDDAAVIPTDGADDLLVATDVLLDGVHFDSQTTDLSRIGHKSLAVNLSDIAAMGGTATAAFVSLALPNRWTQTQVQQLYRGIDALAQEFGVALAGGDTTSWTGRLAINVTVTGRVPQGTALLRSGAQPGDRIFVTGPLGRSLEGSHLDFTPRLREILALRSRTQPHAAIDISDGLAADLHHVLRGSDVRAILWADRIPVRYSLDGIRTRAQLEHALCDGEDFELLLCLAESAAEDFAEDPPPGVSLFEIGRIEDREGHQPPTCQLEFDDGSSEPLTARGWSHEFGN